jgi:hypothetical protein
MSAGSPRIFALCAVAVILPVDLAMVSAVESIAYAPAFFAAAFAAGRSKVCTTKIDNGKILGINSKRAR